MILKIGFRNRKKLTEWSMRTRAMLAAAIVTLVGLSSTAVASYKTSVSASDSARVAVWANDAAKKAGQSDEIVLEKTDVFKSYSIIISNPASRTAEVAQTYDVSLSMAGANAPWLPTGLTAVLRGPGENQAQAFDASKWNSESRAYVITGVGSFEPGIAASQEYTLEFTLNVEQAAMAGTENFKLENVNVDVIFTQID